MITPRLYSNLSPLIFRVAIASLLTAALPALLVSCGSNPTSNSSSDSGTSSQDNTISQGDSSPTSAASPTTAPSTASSSEAATDIAGRYQVRGSNPDKSTYTGALNITNRDAVYQFAWEAGTPVEGVGIQQDDFVAVGYGAQGCAVVSYRVQPDGSLQGVWGVYGQNTTGTEQAVLTGSPTTGIAGAYDITGTNMDGSAYRGKLTITPRGDAYQFTWEVGNTFRGIGIQKGDFVAVGHGADEACSVVAYELQPDGSLDGIWSLVSQEALGTEQATPE